MDFELVGREEELVSLQSFLRDPRTEPAALVIEGEAGIGKSSLWLSGVEDARARDVRVLSSRPAEAERELAQVGLIDLFEAVEMCCRCSTPSAVRSDRAAARPGVCRPCRSPRAGGRGAKCARAARRPGLVLVAVDDVQRSIRRRRARSRLHATAQRDPGAFAACEASRRRRATDRCRAGVRWSASSSCDRPLSVGALLVSPRSNRWSVRPSTLLRIHDSSGTCSSHSSSPVASIRGRPTGPAPVPATPMQRFARPDRASHRRKLGLASALGTASSRCSRGRHRPGGLDAAVAAHVPAKGGRVRASAASSALYCDLGGSGGRSTDGSHLVDGRCCTHDTSHSCQHHEEWRRLEAAAALAASRRVGRRAADLGACVPPDASDHPARRSRRSRRHGRITRLESGRAHEPRDGLLAESGPDSSRRALVCSPSSRSRIVRPRCWRRRSSSSLASGAGGRDSTSRVGPPVRQRPCALGARVAEQLDDDGQLALAPCLILAWFAGTGGPSVFRARDFADAVGGDQVQEGTLALVNTLPVGRQAGPNAARARGTRGRSERDELRALTRAGARLGRVLGRELEAAAAHGLRLRHLDPIRLQWPQDHCRSPLSRSTAVAGARARHLGASSPMNSSCLIFTAAAPRPSVSLALERARPPPFARAGAERRRRAG